MTTAICIEYCPTHHGLCELDADHNGDHECPQCPTAAARHRAQMIGDRVTAHKTLRGVFPTAPDED